MNQIFTLRKMSRPHDHRRLHDPTVIGPGMWTSIHIAAGAATTPEAQAGVCQYHLRPLQANFPCGVCKEHFGQYLSQHPPELIIGTSPDALFYWTVDFHNTVNSFNRKPQLSRQEAKDLFITKAGEYFCTADCGKAEAPSTRSKTEAASAPPRLAPPTRPRIHGY